MSRTVSATCSSDLATTPTRVPARASAKAVARPMPRLPPVTIATWFCSSPKTESAFIVVSLQISASAGRQRTNQFGTGSDLFWLPPKHVVCAGQLSPQFPPSVADGRRLTSPDTLFSDIENKEGSDINCQQGVTEFGFGLS